MSQLLVGRFLIFCPIYWSLFFVENTQELIVPSYSLWFSLDHIHEIEVKAFPDFFPINYVIHGTSTSVASQNSGETTAPEGTNEIVTSENRASGNLKTPDSYKELSNFIVNFYRANPKQYLTVTACRRHRVGDVSSIIRVHTFLEQWGIINFQVKMKILVFCIIFTYP